MCSPVSLGELIGRLAPAEPQTPTHMVQIGGEPTIQANLIRVDFSKESFDRRPFPTADDRPSLSAWGEPPARLGFDLVNSAIARIRTLGRGCDLQQLDADTSFWTLDYLSDNGEILPKEPDFIRRRGGRPFRWRYTALTASLWQKAMEMPAGYSPPVWDTLILDAEGLLPDVDAAVALANASLEVFSKWLLDQLAEASTLPGDLWFWINDRGDWTKEPSVADRFDTLLKVFTGHSLKESTALWEAFKSLRAARNSFSHEGKPTLGGKRPREVTVDIATTLVGQAHQIIDWCENLLPESRRRAKLTTSLDFFFPINTEGFPTLRDDGEEPPRAPSA
jgi:hypothetical protein